MKKNETVKSILSGAEIVSLDFTKDNHYNFLTDLYGGAEYMQKNLPHLSSLVSETREQHVREGGPQYKTVLQLTEAPKDFVDGIYIDHIIYDQKDTCLQVKVSVSLTEQAYWIDSKIEIYTEEGEYVNTRFDTVYDSHYRTIEYTIRNIDMSISESQIFVSTLQVSWQPVASQTLRSQLLTRKIYTNVVTAVTEIRVNDPRNINTEPGENIYVVYGRTPGSKEKVDYDYNAQDRPQHLFLDVAGNATLSDKYVFDRVDQKNSYLLLDCSYGCALYLGDITNRFNSMDGGFNWKLNNDWKTSVPTPAGKYKGVAFRMKVNFYCKGKPYSYDLYIASDMDEELTRYPNYKKIPFITILWGCLARGTNVRMADGSLRKIEDIRISEQVINPYHDGSATVTNTWSGKENMIYRIETREGRCIEASENHPVLTERGIVEAGKIVEGDRLLTGEGTYDAVASQYPIHYDDAVYNLELECDKCGEAWQAHTMVCNDLVVGDNNLQNSIAGADDDEHLARIPDALRNELELVRSLREAKERL